MRADLFRKSRRDRLAFLAVVSVLQTAVSMGQAETAADLLKEDGVDGGLIVHVGCGDGRVTAALRATDRSLVHGLDRDSVDIASAREYIHQRGLDGVVAVARWSGNDLPYTDNLVNRFFVEDRGQVAVEEVLRALAPEGVAYLKDGDRWEKVVKPRPEAIDEWTHYLHDAGNNAVARDALVGPPRRMQWLAAPAWSRNHHTLASISSLVSSRGRVFYIVDEATSASMIVPGRWSLVARDAFNGVLLWKRRIPSWAWHRHGFRAGPVQLPRTLVAVDDRVYVPLGMSAPVSAIDAASGETVRSYESTAGAEEFIVNHGVLLVVTGSPMAEQAAIDPARRGKASVSFDKAIVGAQAASGAVLWRWSDSDLGNPVPLTLASEKERVFFVARGTVVCLDLRSGRELWRFRRAAGQGAAERPAKPAKTGKKRRPRSRIGWSIATLLAHDGAVFWADGKRVEALSAPEGRPLWASDCGAGFRSPVDVLAAGGLVWIGPDYTAGRDPLTGEIRKRTMPVDELRTAGHHHRCYREKGTDRYIIGGYRGMEFFDLVAGNHSRNNWVRGTCQYGIMPCNGLTYVPPHACGCYMEGKLYGFWALAPASSSEEGTDGGRQRPAVQLEKGPAYEHLDIRRRESQGRDEAGSATGASADWPTYRHDGARTGTTSAVLPARLSSAWETEIGGRLSSVTVAEGKVFIASVDRHSVYALNAEDGGVVWRYAAGGRVDGPPTIHRGLALFGSADGWVYCLRASDGTLVWRFRAARAERYTVAFDRVESVWPLHGSVLVQSGLAYVAAGRSSYLDGGIHLYGLDPLTGDVACRSLLQNAHPRGGEGRDRSDIAGEKIQQNATDYKTYAESDSSDAFSMSGAITDVLVGDGSSVYMRHLGFDRNWAAREKGRPHLFSTSRLLDGTEAHRSHWVIGTGDFSRMPVAYSWIAYKPGHYGGYRLSVPYGLMLTFDSENVWGVLRTKSYGYRIFRAENTTRRETESGLPDFRKSSDEKSRGFTWIRELAMRPRSVLRAGGSLLLGGMPRETGEEDPHAAPEDRKGGLLWVMSTKDGKKTAERALSSPPVWDGMAAVDGRLYLATVDGKVICMAEDGQPARQPLKAPDAAESDR